MEKKHDHIHYGQEKEHDCSCHSEEHSSCCEDKCCESKCCDGKSHESHECNDHDGCGCGCGCHGGGHSDGKSTFLWPGISFALLIAGILMNHLSIGWFTIPVVNLLWFVIAFLPVGLPVIKEGWEAMLAKDYFSEFTLMIVASIGAFCIGEYPEAVAVMLFYTVGEIFQHRAVDKATRNISQLLDVRPERATVIRDGETVEMAPQDVVPGEIIEVKPGGRVPLDGELLDAEALFDTSALTGESMPRSIAKDGEVLAGMIADGQPVRIRVNRPYGQSALARILNLVKEASGRKAPTELFIRRFARIYTPVVILLAFLIVAVPAIVGATGHFDYVFSEWLYRGLVFLVISCPCALVISVPLGYFAGIGAASRAGVLVKGGNYLEALAKVDAVAFDKTGTLTTGRFEVSEIDIQGVDRDTFLSYILSLEKGSTHPIAKAVSVYAAANGGRELAVTGMKEISGQGVEATIDGKTVAVGNMRLMESRNIAVPEKLGKSSATLVICAVDGHYCGYLSLADAVKPDAQLAVQRLKDLGVADVYMLSGDRKEVVADYASRLGINHALGALMPEDKAQHISDLIHSQGRNVAFVGDGMNDAPVLALSTVGVAMGGLGSDAAVESADVVVQTDQPSKVATAIRIARTTATVVRENIIGAISIKVIVLVAGALGYASLWGAVFADVGVALLAVLNSLRILYMKHRA